MALSDLIGLLASGITGGMILFLVAAGLTLVFGVLLIINFAHGAFYMLAAYTCYSLATYFGKGPYSYWLALILAPTLVAVLGAFTEVVFLKPIYKRDHLMQLLLMYAIGLILVDGVKFIWGPQPKYVYMPSILAGGTSVLGASIPLYNIFLMALGVGAMGGIWVFLNKTKLGHIIRAGAFDSEMAAMLGINMPRIYTFVFAFGVWMAGLAGALIAPLTTLSQGMDASMIIEAFTVVVIGGMGSVEGAFLASIAVGLVHAFGLLWIPGIAIAFIFIVMTVILVIRPWGLLGKPIK